MMPHGIFVTVLDPAVMAEIEGRVKSPTEGTPVTIRVMLRGKVETFTHRVPDYENATIEALVDLYEGQIGTVLDIKTVGLITLFQGMVEEGEFE